jgi:hypothetical protein
MGLIPKEMEELRDMLRLYDKGKISEKQVHTKIAIYSQLEKRMKLWIMTEIAMSTHKSASIRILASNLIGNLVAIDIGGDPQMEKVACSLNGQKIILRQECLDISGHKKNYEICKECMNFAITRQLLLQEE